jgi:hypothetical protein
MHFRKVREERRLWKRKRERVNREWSVFGKRNCEQELKEGV